MAARTPNLPLLAGAGFSLLLHGAAILPMMMAAMGVSMESVVMRGRFDPDDFAEPPGEEEDTPPEEPRNEVELGIDEKTPSTLTWVGHDHYEEHLAHLAEVEQAAFADRAAAPGEADATVAAAPAPASVEAQPSTPAEPSEAPEPPAESAPPEAAPPREPIEMVQAAPPPSEIEAEAEPTTPAVAVDQIPTPEPAVAPRLLALAAPNLPVAPVGNLVEPEDPTPGAASPPPSALAPDQPTPDQKADAEARTEPKTEPDPDARPDPDAQAEPDEKTEPVETDAKPPPVPAQPAPPSPAQPASNPQPPAPGSKEPSVGEPSPKESDATSTQEVPIDQLKLGKPIARQGLELMPRRPRFTTLMKITAAPGNPLIEIRFDRSGRPKKALILQTSGDARIDHAIEASLYRWRARGAKLKELGAQETANIQLRIILNPRRR